MVSLEKLCGIKTKLGQISLQWASENPLNYFGRGFGCASAYFVNQLKVAWPQWLLGHANALDQLWKW